MPRSRLVCFLVSISISALGLWLSWSLPLEWLPGTDHAALTVTAKWPGVSSEKFENLLLSRLERELQGIPVLVSPESISGSGEGSIRLRVDPRSKPGVAKAEILDRIASIHGTLPPGVHLDVVSKPPKTLEQQQAFFILQLIAPLPASQLRTLAEDRLATTLLRLTGLAGVEIDGGEERDLRATLKPDFLERPMDSLAGFRRGLFDALEDKGYGTSSMASGNALLYRTAQQSVVSLAGLPMASEGARSGVVRLSDLSRLEQVGAPRRTISRIDGKTVVTLTLHRAPDSHLLRVAREVRKTVEEIRTDLPPGTELLIADDRSEDVRKQLHDLALRGGLGFLLLLGVLFVMLRSSKAVGIALFAVLVSLSAAIILFKPLGLTLNVLTIAGLVLLFGLLIDNAVVVIERLQAELANARGGGASGYAAAARRAVKAVWLPLLGGTLTTCAVFLPMVYLSGELRGLFASFAVLSALTLGFSLVASVILIPNLGQSLRGHRPRKISGLRRLRGVWLLPYRVAHRHPRLCFLLLLLAIGLPTPLLPDFMEEPSEGWRSQEDRDFAERYNRTLGSDAFRNARQWLDPLVGGVTRPFLKDVELGKRWDFPERPEVKVWIQLPAGSGIERADERIRPFEEEARRSPAVKRTLVHVSGRTARMNVLFHDVAMDTAEPYLLRERLIAHGLQIAGMEVSVSGLVPMGFYSGLGQVSGFTVHAFGPTYETLEEVSKNFARRLERYPRVAEVDINAAGHRQPPAREVIRFHWGAEAVARTGLSTRDLAAVLRPQLWRETPDFYADLEGDPRMPVRIVMEGAEKLDLDTLLHRPLAAGAGGPVRLADHAALSIEKDPPVIERIDQQYRRTLQVYYRGPYRMGKEMLDKEIAGLVLPPGYRVERPSYEFFDAAVKRQFFWLILGTVGLVFLVIAAVLESWRLAGVVMLSVPLSWIGIALAFVWTGQNFAEGAFIGVVLTVGIAVNDAILLADGYRRLRLARPRTPVPRLALLALRQRLRPMWTTTLTSIASMLPLLVIPDAGNFWVGLAVTVVGGLVASTLLAPAATLALLSWGARSLPAGEPEKVPAPLVLTEA